MGEPGPRLSFEMHVRGGGDVVYVIASILDALGVQGIEFAGGTGIFSLESAGVWLQEWQAYRDQVVRESQPGGGNSHP